MTLFVIIMKKTSNRMSFLFAFKLIQINNLVFPQTHWLLTASSPKRSQCEMKRGEDGAAVKVLVPLQGTTKLWAPQEVGRWFESNLGSHLNRLQNLNQSVRLEVCFFFITPDVSGFFYFILIVHFFHFSLNFENLNLKIFIL